MKLFMNDVGILRLDLVCFCIICDCLVFGMWDRIIDTWIWNFIKNVYNCESIVVKLWW